MPCSEAVRAYEIGLRSRPEDPAALLGLARALTDAAELDEAGRRLDALLAGHPDHADGLTRGPGQLAR